MTTCTAPEGTAARPIRIPSTKQSTSTVGLPRESMIARALRSVIMPPINYFEEQLWSECYCGQTRNLTNSANEILYSELRELEFRNGRLLPSKVVLQKEILKITQP